MSNPELDQAEFDAQLVQAAFALGADAGWRNVSAAAAARRAGLDLVTARARLASRARILMKFGELADRHALTGALEEGSTRERLFDVLLRRFDFLQLHRAGVIALMRELPLDPLLAALLARATLTSMGWMLEAAGERSQGLLGELRKRGLAVVWAIGLRAWLRDESPDLTATMAAVDTALNRADALAARFSSAGIEGAGAAPAEPAMDATFEAAIYDQAGDQASDQSGAPDLPFPEDPSALA
jgi:hypothetical protein